MRLIKTIILSLLFVLNCQYFLFAQTKPIVFGSETVLNTPGLKNRVTPVNWINVNTDADTWKMNKGVLTCSGHPIGIMRSEKQYENFILQVDWMHLEAGGNSGVFVWSDAIPAAYIRLPGGVEVQMLELDYINLHTLDGKKLPIAVVEGELFGVNGVKTVPDSARGDRSEPTENRCKGKGEWNSYTVVCIDGVIKLSINGKFVNGISKSTVKKGYLCLESEGAAIHFRNLKITEL